MCRLFIGVGKAQHAGIVIGPAEEQEAKIYELCVSPMTTSNVFLAGHRLRIEISSSNFPRFQRNLNTGGDNFTEAQPVIARNRIHYSAEHPSRIVIPVVD